MDNSTLVQRPFIVRAYFQTDPEHCFSPYTGKGTFAPSSLNDIEVSAGTVYHAADKVYTLMTSPKPKSANAERTLRVGDVLEIYEAPTGQDELTVLAVESVGFTNIRDFAFRK